MKKILNWLIDKWLAGFITAAIFFFLKIYSELPSESKNHFFHFGWVYEVINTNVPIWSFLIVVLAIVVITRIEKRQIIKRNNTVGKKDEIPTPVFGFYRKDQFGVNQRTWTWDYEWDKFDEKYNIVNLRPSCPTCFTPMDIDSGGSFYSATGDCHKCRLEGKRTSFPLSENASDVEKEIIRRIVSKEFMN